MYYVAKIITAGLLATAGAAGALTSAINFYTNGVRRNEIDATPIMRTRDDLAERIERLEEIRSTLTLERRLRITGAKAETPPPQQALIDQAEMVATYIEGLIIERKKELETTEENGEFKQLAQERSNLEHNELALAFPGGLLLTAVALMYFDNVRRRERDKKML